MVTSFIFKWNIFQLNHNGLYLSNETTYLLLFGTIKHLEMYLANFPTKKKLIP